MDNILLDDKLTFKLADFGSASSVKENQKINYPNPIGTFKYMSPEKLAGTLHCPKQADLYAAGIILYMMVTGDFPFTENKKEDMIYDLFLNDIDFFWQIVEEENQFLSDELKDLLTKML